MNSVSNGLLPGLMSDAKRIESLRIARPGLSGLEVAEQLGIPIGRVQQLSKEASLTSLRQRIKAGGMIIGGNEPGRDCRSVYPLRFGSLIHFDTSRIGYITEAGKEPLPLFLAVAVDALTNWNCAQFLPLGIAHTPACREFFDAVIREIGDVIDAVNLDGRPDNYPVMQDLLSQGIYCLTGSGGLSGMWANVRAEAAFSRLRPHIARLTRQEMLNKEAREAALANAVYGINWRAKKTKRTSTPNPALLRDRFHDRDVTHQDVITMMEERNHKDIVVTAMGEPWSPVEGNKQWAWLASSRVKKVYTSRPDEERFTGPAPAFHWAQNT